MRTSSVVEKILPFDRLNINEFCPFRALYFDCLNSNEWLKNTPSFMKLNMKWGDEVSDIRGLSY